MILSEYLRKFEPKLTSTNIGGKNSFERTGSNCGIPILERTIFAEMHTIPNVGFHSLDDCPPNV